jgi:hypothetical protein
MRRCHPLLCCTLSKCGPPLWRNRSSSRRAKLYMIDKASVRSNCAPLLFVIRTCWIWVAPGASRPIRRNISSEVFTSHNNGDQFGAPFPQSPPWKAIRMRLCLIHTRVPSYIPPPFLSHLRACFFLILLALPVHRSILTKRHITTSTSLPSDPSLSFRLTVHRRTSLIACFLRHQHSFHFHLCHSFLFLSARFSPSQFKVWV